MSVCGWKVGECLCVSRSKLCVGGHELSDCVHQCNYSTDPQ